MEDGSVEEAVVVRYLLGDLPEEALIQVEDRAFHDPEYLHLIEAVEADLIDAYMRNQLQPEERRQFESRFLTSAERRKKLEFAQAWSRVADEAKTAAQQPRAASDTEARRWWRELFAFLRGPAPAFRFAGAAIAVLLIGVLCWQALESSKLRNRVHELEAERSNQQQREQALKSNLAAERGRLDELTSQMQRGLPPIAASLTLMPGSLRDASVRPEILIAPSTQIVRLEIQIEPKDNYPQYRAELRTQRGEQVLTRNNLREQRGSAGRFVVLEIPSNAVDSGQYELTLQGKAAPEQLEDLAYYRFSVRR